MDSGDSNARYAHRNTIRYQSVDERESGGKPMTACPECGTTLPMEAKFCKNCGSSISNTCLDCGTSVSDGAAYCPSCGTNLRGDADTGPATASNDGSLRLPPKTFASRIRESQLKADGLLNWLRQKQEVNVEAGNRALLLENGELKVELGPGSHTLDTLRNKLTDLRRGENFVAVLVEDGETQVSLRVENVRTATEYPIDVEMELIVGIDEPELFFTTLMADRDAITTDDFERLLGDALRDELEATLSQYEYEQLYGNRDLKQKLRQDIDRQCRDTFRRNGLRLVELRSFDYDDDRDEIREGRKQVDIREDKEDIADSEAELDRWERERETDDTVHQENQRVRRKTAEQSADHEIETQEIEQEHEKDDMQRRHGHKAKREQVEHEEEKKTVRKERETERRAIEHEQDTEELEDLIDIKAKKDQQKLNRKEREQDLDIRKDKHDVEVEQERLEARDSVDLETLASMEDVDEAVAELAEIEKAEDLTPEQLEALGAKDSDELAKARQEAHDAEAERQRVEDQKEFREEIKEMAEDSMDRMQETGETAMDSVSETGQAAAEDTSDNVIVSGTDGGSDSGDTTIVQGGTESGGDGGDAPDKMIVCPECGGEMSYGNDFCTNCGFEFER